MRGKKFLVSTVAMSLALAIALGGVLFYSKTEAKASKVEEATDFEETIENEEIGEPTGDIKGDLISEGISLGADLVFKWAQKGANNKYMNLLNKEYKKQIKEGKIKKGNPIMEYEFSREKQRVWFRTKAYTFNKGKFGTRAMLQFNVDPIVPTQYGNKVVRWENGQSSVYLRIETDALNNNEKFCVVVKNPNGEIVYDKVIKASMVNTTKLFTAEKFKENFKNKACKTPYGKYTIEISTTSKVSVRYYVDMYDGSNFKIDKKYDRGGNLVY